MARRRSSDPPRSDRVEPDVVDADFRPVGADAPPESAPAPAPRRRTTTPPLPPSSARRRSGADATATAAADTAARLPASPIAIACALALAAAVSLGITRFAYALLLPPMRTDLSWSYTLAGAMNTVNALGYLLGALATPWLMRRLGPARVLLWGALLASLFMGWSGFFVEAAPLLVQRLLAGIASAFVFIAGGLFAARLAARQPARGGLLLGLYYGGVGLGIVLSALLVPPLLEAARGVPHGWSWSWWVLALLCFAASAALWWPVAAMQRLDAHDAAAASNSRSTAAAAKKNAKGKRAPQASAATSAVVASTFRWRDFAPALAGYGLFGVGYIGYMTFVVALLKDLGVGAASVVAFYALLGLAVMASSRIWAGLLDRAEGGRALALLNALLGAATILPALTHHEPLLFASGLLFGGVFLSVVASTTALVRRELAPDAWAAGISAFTIVFAFGQIVGPTMVGWIADGPGGLERGFVFSAIALWAGALIALRQRSGVGDTRA